MDNNHISKCAIDPQSIEECNPQTNYGPYPVSVNPTRSGPRRKRNEKGQYLVHYSL